MRAKKFSAKQLEAVRHIRNWIQLRGRTPSIRELMEALNYKSPRSAQVVLEELLEMGIIQKFSDGGYQLLTNPDLGSGHVETVNVPVVGSVAAGAPILAEENIEGFIPVSTFLAKHGSKYFLLHVKGDSMNKGGINDGDLVLVRQQPTANNGERVVALIDNEATVKEFRRAKGAVILYPKSSNPKHMPIVMTEDFQIQGVIIATLPKQ